MSREVNVLTDVAAGIWLEDFSLAPADLPASGMRGNWNISKRTMRGGLADGVDVVTLDNGELSLEVLPTRGMGIWRGQFQGHFLGWDSPVKQPVHPRHVALDGLNGLGWLTGFNELLCRCGLAWNGPPGVDTAGNGVESALTLHGRIANLPAHRVDVAVDEADGGSLSVTGVIDESAMFGSFLRLQSTTILAADGGNFRVIDEVTNCSGKPAELQLLYHTNVGRPFLDAGAEFVAAADVVAPRDDRAAEGIDGYPRYLGPTPGYAEQVYYYSLLTDAQQKTQVLLKNAEGNLGLALAFSKTCLPCFALWKNTQLDAEGYVTGLEPATNFPNFRAFEREKGRAVPLQPDETYRTELEFSILTTAAEVEETAARIVELQQGQELIVHDDPDSEFSPV